MDNYFDVSSEDETVTLIMSKDIAALLMETLDMAVPNEEDYKSNLIEDISRELDGVL